MGFSCLTPPLIKVMLQASFVVFICKGRRSQYLGESCREEYVTTPYPCRLETMLFGGVMGCSVKRARCDKHRGILSRMTFSCCFVLQ